MKKVVLSSALIVASLIYVYSKSGTSTIAVQVAPTVTVSPTPKTVTLPVTQAPVVSSTPPPPPPAPKKVVAASGYTDGTYTGSVADAYYGNVQVQVTIQSGSITAVDFLQYPSDRSTSRYINGQATPILAQEAIKAQSASVNGVSGASDTSQAFVQSLSSALAQAKA